MAPDHFFEFEADFVDSLRCIPMQVRFKLDTCGIKLKLPHWHQFTPEERQALAEMSCSPNQTQVYREFLHQLVLKRTGVPATDLAIEADPAWMEATTIPATVEEKAQEAEVSITPQQWAALTPLQRFALIKLSRSNHENKNFLPALKEFHLI